ncbi:MAG: PilZ domain-containing protein [Bdellovibrionaceae bacterium]|nr:PilZ domain-containing protein [Pseudobdellovibrionaceae bacterium]
MAKYHLVHIDSKGTFFNLTRLEMVTKLKQAGDLQNWFCWYPGIVQWKQVSQAHEVREWMATPWTEDQPMPPWQDLFTSRARSESQDFEVVEFNDSAAITPPPVPTEPKTEFVISGFSGQVFDFDESLKDKHLNKNDFKIIKDENKNADEANRFENTVKVDTSANDFEKTISSSTVLTTEQTQTAIANPSFEHTSKINLNDTQRVDQETVTGKIVTVPEMTITKELPAIEKTALPPEPNTANVSQAAANNAGKKHNRRYPRINGRLRTIITNKAKAFMTFTKDISLGGIQVENNIPQDILNSEIEVYVSDPTGKKSILFRCHPVGDMKNPCRFSFAKADEKNLQKLSQWLDDLAKINAA